MESQSSSLSSPLDGVDDKRWGGVVIGGGGGQRAPVGETGGEGAEEE